ncbi:MAG: ATP-binding cassette domain-containing protein [Chloroflexota bacterium]|nr:ATP-binding cassette domain-containing protein [Chloroflexota bacterium]MDE2841011.1 ATP-binding cassette domain-containing protein [Chloroflexota bacterium]MDE2930332.1 ATP-binding cassette domain-containing protein [Chloroflexota bacterium]
MQPLEKTHNLRHTYADGMQVHLAGCDLAIWPKDRVAVVGANGAGKSTLFLLLGMLRPSDGAVQVLGHDPAADFPKIRQSIGVVLQNVEYQILAPTVW